MKQLVEDFAQQLRDAIDIGEKATVTFSGAEYNNVVMAGMGASGIGCNLMQAYVADKLHVPVVVSKSYTIPAFVGPGTLFIASSFSGNTEEIIYSVRAAMNSGARVAFLTAGGELLRIAREEGIPYLLIPQEPRHPRACLGYSLVAMLYLLHYSGLLDDTFKTELRQSVALLEEQAGIIKVQASALANAFHTKMPVLYVSDALEPVALRFQQQLNENAKQLCHVNTFPEMNYNEIVGWQNPGDIYQQLAVLLIKTAYDHPRVQLRMSLSKKLFESKVPDVLEIEAQGATFLEQALYLIHLFDWVSVYLAKLSNVNPEDIDNIDYLKGKLSRA
ncbi:bifunctional phosphoglucose/phosphomannose isomerase [Pontibacter sp. E15-1]|uniref:bifunctional phosphoglucose/phosphomannose isomerase n=1 Tax=Pontibacter sp. E15-1 TaxID=2919918 RepID=UPI001F4F827A|nr:bifunctional phosphoglucose/phosphomannose isomerase [Pontibacter sp. E15-1]MCJ8166151.1 bifunctional phosphoglucose/phosphomannose isomerase [Pontibacter sp. E15-1]